MFSCPLKVIFGGLIGASEHKGQYTDTDADARAHTRMRTHTQPLVGFLTGDFISTSGDFVFFLVVRLDSTGLLDFAFFSSRGFTVTLAFAVTSNM